jgi:AcrR family transcriptional regulator
MRDAIAATVPDPMTAANRLPGPTQAPLDNSERGLLRGRERRTLTRADWTAAALDALARDGLRAVAVEPLAERLGATKGSFYWHFRDRNALLEAAALQWERSATDEVLDELEQVEDPSARLSGLMDSFSAPGRENQILMALLWNADHPAIGPVIGRVLTKRMEFCLRCREEAGEDARRARESVMCAYSVVLGLHLLRRAAPQLASDLGAPQELRDYVTSMIREAAGAYLPAAA